MRWFVATLLLSVCISLHAQELVHHGNTYSLVTIVSPSQASMGHQSADVFVHQIDDLLRKNFPSQVSKPRVVLHYWNNQLSFEWSCEIIKTIPEKADWYFDHKGTLRFGKDLRTVIEEAREDIEGSKKVQIMINGFDMRYGSHRLPNGFVSSSFTEDPYGSWYVEEYFVTAPRPVQ